MNNIEAIEFIKNEYLNSGAEIKVQKVTDTMLLNMLIVCDNTKHIEERIAYYDEEDNPNLNNWIDIEGEGYGWLWSNYPEEKWHEILKNSMLDYIKYKESEIKKQDESVIIVNRNDEIIYHFIERDSSLRDIIYTFSNNELNF